MLAHERTLSELAHGNSTLYRGDRTSGSRSARGLVVLRCRYSNWEQGREQLGQLLTSLSGCEVKPQS